MLRVRGVARPVEFVSNREQFHRKKGRGPGFVERLITRLIDNLVVLVKNVHLRYVFPKGIKTASPRFLTGCIESWYGLILLTGGCQV